MKIDAFWCTIFVRDISDEISYFFGPLGALRMRFHACLALMRFLDEMSCFSAAEFSF